MKNEYRYPLDLDWTTEEMVRVTTLWASVEEAYETGIQVETFLKHYVAFKTVIQTIGEERKLGREFERVSNYSLYHTLQEAKRLQSGVLKMEIETGKEKSRKK